MSLKSGGVRTETDKDTGRTLWEGEGIGQEEPSISQGRLQETQN